ncbi:MULTISPECIES: DUF6804 family protein [unclassified Salinibacterium]|uniref:DUF6804 family protein n=1 Tax=unclassified Salinibacterium TaxID=2632331 RepID=UPI0014207D6F|nr:MULTISPECIES: DUF6804 family protein [unclassified Salinibacterium]
MTNYNAPAFRRTALLPSIIPVIALLIGVALIGTDSFTIIRYVVSIFAVIVLVFAVQARSWWWVLPLAAIAVLWNPVFPFGFEGDLWLGMQYIAALIFIGAGVFVKDRSVH